MQNEIILARFKELKLTPTGKREISSLSDVDNGFASNLLRAINDIQFLHPRRQDASMVEFLKRSDSDKLSVGNYPDIKALLSAQNASGAGQKDTPTAVPINRHALPLINIGRDVTYSFYVGEHERDELDYGQLYDEKEQITAVVSKVPVQLTYKVWVLAFDLDTLGHLTGAIGTWMRLWQSQGETAYQCTTSLCGIAVNIDNVFDAPKAVDWSDISADIGTDRIFAAELLVTVVSAQLVAHLVDASSVRNEVVLGISDGN